MNILMLVPILMGMLTAVVAYRLGIADGLSAGRYGRLAGSRTAKEEQSLLKRIEAYDGRKGKNHAE